jgi:hypothetical protein
MAIKAEDFKSIGGFDFDFFAHMEEIDLCWRLKNTGKRILYCGESTVYHVGGGTLSYNSPRKTFLNYRNNLCMIHKNFSGKSPLWVMITIRMILDQISILKFLLEWQPKNIIEIIKAHISYLTNIPSTQKKRKSIKKAPLYKMKGVLVHSLIWKFFVTKKYTFSQIIQKNE